MFSGLHLEVYAWIRGGILVLVIYHILIYFQNKRKSYLFYSLYLFGIFVYFYQHVLVIEVAQIVYKYLNFSVQLLAYAAFIGFTRSLIETKIYNVVWDKYLELVIKVLIALAPILLLFN